MITGLFCTLWPYLSLRLECPLGPFCVSMGWRPKEARRAEAKALRKAAKRCGLSKESGWGSLRDDSGFSVVQAVATSCAASGGSPGAKEAAGKAWKAFRKGPAQSAGESGVRRHRRKVWHVTPQFP